MSNYKDTYELYQSTFDEVHASDELIQRIKNRDTKHIKKRDSNLYQLLRRVWLP